MHQPDPSASIHFVRGARSAVLLFVIATASLLLLACGGDDAGTAATASPGAAASTGTSTPGSPQTIRITGDGIEPDNVTVTLGTRVTLVNETDDTQELHLAGDGDGEPQTLSLEPGQSIDLPLTRAGGYVLTSPDDAGLSGGVLVTTD